jgi:hypothetical protein
MAPPAAAFLPAGAGVMAVWGGPDQGSRARVVPIRLKKGAKAAKSLQEITGSVTAQVLGQSRPLVTVANVLESSGKTVKGAEGGSIRLLDVTKERDGRFNLRLEVDLPDGKPMGGANGRDRVVLGDGGMNSSRHELTLEDKDGHLLTPFGMRVQGGAKGVEFTLTYLPQKGQGEPAKLVLTESKSVAVEVPFTLKDVPLP